MIKIAFVHWNGLAAGGTEQFLQTVAANLPQDRFKVDFYYAGCAAQHRKQYMLEHGVNLIEFHFRNRVEKGRYTYFSDCDFDKVFTGDYDLVQAGRYGSAESFFECIRKIPIIDSVHYVRALTISVIFPASCIFLSSAGICGSGKAGMPDGWL